MKNEFLAALFGPALLIVSAQSQGTFQNLDFEAAHNLPAGGGGVATTNALPGWSAFAGTSLLSSIPYNAVVAVPQVGLYGFTGFEIQGHFDVLSYNGGSISQSGLVPTNTASLLFKGSWTSLTPVGVFLGGQSLSYTAISNGPNYTLYGADISAFAGQTASLSFLAAAGNIYVIDDIQFSPAAVPEPATSTLFGFGGFFIAVHLVRRRCSKP